MRAHSSDTDNVRNCQIEQMMSSENLVEFTCSSAKGTVLSQLERKHKLPNVQREKMSSERHPCGRSKIQVVDDELISSF